MFKSLIKYSGTGNKFILVDDRDGSMANITTEAIALSESHDVDGVLLMQSSNEADIKMRIINRDGSEAEMCGNGARCAAHWAHHEAELPAQFSMQTGAGAVEASVSENIVKVKLTNPINFRLVPEISVPNALGAPAYIDTGVPHLVSEVNAVLDLDIESVGAMVRNHPSLAPKGANASFYALNEGGIQCRVFERGVEGETLSCGTGSAACALIASLNHELTSPIKVLVQSGDILNIYFDHNESGFKDVYLEGPVEILERI
ncbi:MAG: diaminopimelate epimerase [Candidatus Omnitrophota bacterium]|jgi:diaminopimelate epimerase